MRVRKDLLQRLGEMRERVVMLDKMADLLRAGGMLDDALHILEQRVLPALEQMGAVRECEITRQIIATIRAGE
jgi:hypothetical protein